MDKIKLTKVAAPVLAVFAVILGGGWLMATSWASPDSTHVALVWSGGPFDSKQYDGYKAPGSGRSYVGQMQKVVEFPTGIRQYAVGSGPGADFPDPLSISVRGFAMSWTPTINFTLNTLVVDGKPVVADFYERHLRQFGAIDFDNVEGGAKWVGFLNTRILPVLREVMARELPARDPVKLRFNTDGERDKAATDVGAALSEKIEENLGGRFFCRANYTFASDDCGTVQVQLPEPGVSADVQATLEKPQQAAVEANNAIATETENTRRANEVAAQREAQVAAAQRQAAADQSIAAVQGAANTLAAQRDFAWCAELVRLGQNCALVKAAIEGSFPTVLGGDAAVVAPARTQ